MSPVKKFDKLLYEGLLEKKLISEKNLQPILEETDSSGRNLAVLLLDKKLLPEKDILTVLAEKLKLSCVNLKNISVDKSVVDKVPVRIASYYKFIPLEIHNRILKIAVSFPLDIKTQDEIRVQLGYEIKEVLCGTDEIDDGLKRYYGLGADTIREIVSKEPQAPAKPVREIEKESIEDIEKLAETASVIKLVNQLILEGGRKIATDIHLEPYREKIILRYRVDGVLYDASVPTALKNYFKAIVSRIKIMSNLNIVERRLPQDGRAVVKVQDQMLDLRISTMPTPFGESVVIRILPAKMIFNLEKLGLSEKELSIFRDLIKRPHGIIFITGPTGSGKTTTLYASLSEINTRERKIITLEDPIEYEVEGITQIQVMPEISLDFARGLRSILRHDPDVIMVGEVRDLETAEVAVRVALTGHLVFSTLHTNDAASGVTRLIDIGVEPYLLASSVQAFIAQRLVRVICPDCKYKDKEAPRELKELIARDLRLKSAEEVKIFRGKGCSNCNFTGFYGRTAIHEIFLIDEAAKDLILKRLTISQMKKEAVSKGMRTLRQNGWRKVIDGITIPEEVMKVTSAESRTISPETLSPETFTSDKRIYDRLDTKISIRYKAFKSLEDLTKRTGVVPETFSICKNISGGGLLFVSNEEIPAGFTLSLKIELPDGENPIETLAKVIRTEKNDDGHYDVAVCFLDMASGDRLRLDKYVKEV